MCSKGGLDANKPPATWPDLIAAGRRFAAPTLPTAALPPPWLAWIQLEQLGARHNCRSALRPTAAADRTERNFNNPLFVKQVQTLVDMKDKSFDYKGRSNDASASFQSGGAQ